MKSAANPSPILPEAKPKQIRYISFDLDNCIFNAAFKDAQTVYDAKKEEAGTHEYLKARSADLLKANEGLLNEIVKEIKDSNTKHVRLAVGSNRQDVDIDGTNALLQRTGSLAPAMLAIEEHLKKKLPQVECDLDKYLLADTFGNKKPGTAFDLIAADKTGAKKHDKAIVDEYKYLLLFAQTHKAASENLFSHVTFDFYDDHENILKKLHEFYSANPDLLPENLTLRLHHYVDNKYELKSAIQGKTKPIEKYGEGVIQMLKCAGLSDEDIQERSNFNSRQLAEEIKTPEALEKFKLEVQRLQGIVPHPVAKRDHDVEQVLPPDNKGAGEAAAVAHVPVLENQLSPEVMELNDQITELKRNYAHQANISELAQSLEVARNAFSADFKRMHDNKFSAKRIEKSDANKSLQLTQNLLQKLKDQDAAVQMSGLDEFIGGLQKQNRKSKFFNVLSTIAVVTACFLVGAGVGFAVGLGIGAATGPGALFTSIAGALVGAVLAAVIGAGVGGGLGAALGGTFFGRFMHKKYKDELPTHNAMLDVSNKVAAVKAG